MRIADFVTEAGILPRLTATGVDEALREMAGALAIAYSMDPAKIHALLLERERLGSTALGHGIAVPHAKLDVPRTVGVLGLSEAGIDFGAPDGQRVRVLLALVSPLEGGAHLKALSTAARELSDDTFRSALLAAKDAAAIHRLLSR